MKMLTERECKQALENAVDAGIIKKDWKVLNDLIKEHFELVEKYNNTKISLDNISKSYDELYDRHLKQVEKLVYEIEDLNLTLANYVNPQPYKFEELHEGMLVWCEIKSDEYNGNNGYIGSALINEIYKKRIHLTTFIGGRFYMFREGIFFPVIKAMQYQGE